MRGSTGVLVKVVLFQSRGRGHPQGDAMPNFFLILQAFLGLSNGVSFMSGTFQEGG